MSLIKILVVLAASIPSIALAATLEEELRTGRNKKVCSYSDGSTLTIDSYNPCPYSNYGGQTQPKQPKGMSVGDLNQLGPESLQKRYCMHSERQAALMRSIDRNESRGNPLVAQMNIGTATAALRAESEKNKVAGVLERQYGIYMDDSQCP